MADSAGYRKKEKSQDEAAKIGDGGKAKSEKD